MTSLIIIVRLDINTAIVKSITNEKDINILFDLNSKVNVVVKNITGRNSSYKILSCWIFCSPKKRKLATKNTTPILIEKINSLCILKRLFLLKAKTIKNGVNNANEV